MEVGVGDLAGVVQSIETLAWPSMRVTGSMRILDIVLPEPSLELRPRPSSSAVTTSQMRSAEGGHPWSQRSTFTTSWRGFTRGSNLGTMSSPEGTPCTTAEVSRYARSKTSCTGQTLRIAETLPVTAQSPKATSTFERSRTR